MRTDVLDITIGLQHGDIIEAKLLNYPISVEEKNKPFILLQNADGERYVANSSLFTVKGQSMKLQIVILPVSARISVIT